MQSSRWNDRFFESTRGKIILLLRKSSRTVNELAGILDLTDNAVRAHLSTLERDGLVYQYGVKRGSRKPHLSYTLAPEAKNLFPQPYGLLLNQLLAVLSVRLDERTLEAFLQETGHRLAEEHISASEGVTPEEQLENALDVLRSIGGAGEVEEVAGKRYIRGYGCPLSVIVSKHPQICRMVETLLTDIAGVPIRERCKRGEMPHCYFEVIPSPIP